MQIHFILGLPGSGKTWYAAENYAGKIYIMDDIVTYSADEIQQVVDCGFDQLVITDHAACWQPKNVVLTKLLQLFGGHQLVSIPFENDPEQCYKNIQQRNDARIISFEYLTFVSRRYHPEEWGVPIPVYKGG